MLVPAAEERLARHKKLRLLYHLGPDFAGFTAGAMWDDTKIGFNTKQPVLTARNSHRSEIINGYDQ